VEETLAQGVDAAMIQRGQWPVSENQSGKRLEHGTAVLACLEQGMVCKPAPYPAHTSTCGKKHQ
jgi:hypothetical protein